MKKVLLLCCVFGAGLSIAVAVAQTATPSPPPDDIDSYFQTSNPLSPAPTPDTSSENLPPQQASVAPRLFQWSGSSHTEIGGSYGAKEWTNANQTTQDMTGYGGVQTSATIGVNVQPTDDFHMRGEVLAVYPSPKVSVNELFLDYTLASSVLIKAGVYNYVWGNARFFNLANISARSKSGLDNPLDFNFRIVIPFGQNTLSFLGRARDSYFYDVNNPSATLVPSASKGGFGALYEFVTGPVEWFAGYYYQKELTKRAAFGFKTTLAGADVFAESSLAFLNMKDAWQTDILPTFTAGYYYEINSIHARVYSEYAYNGECPENTILVNDAVVMYGHNSITGLRFTKLGPADGVISIAWQQNYTDWSAFICPLFEITPFSHATFRFALPIFLGADDSYLLTYRPVSGTQRIALAFSMRLDYGFKE